MPDSPPISSIYPDGSAIAKGDVRSYENTRSRVRMTVAEVQASDLSGLLGIDIAGISYDLDTSDTTSADDGLMVIVDAVGGRWKRAASGEIVIARDFTGGSHTGDLVRTVVATPWTIPANWFVDSTKRIRVRIWGDFTNGGAPDLAYVGVDFGGNAMQQIPRPAAASENDFMAEFEIVATASSAQNVAGYLLQGGQTLRVAGDNAKTVDMTAARDLQITAQLDDAADTINIDRIEIFVVP